MLGSVNRNASSGRTKNYKFTQLRSSAYWILASVDINENGLGDYTWSQAAAQPWCNGLGTWAQPYIIENVTFVTSQIGLEIQYSDKFFIIRNCTFVNSAYGIRLNRAKNGIITKNNFSNHAQGIRLENQSSNNTLSENILTSNGHGIYTYSWNPNNRIINNTFYYNEYSGIIFNGGGNSCNITNNKIIGIGGLTGSMIAGIFLYTSSNNIIKDNIILNSSDEGIQFSNTCNNNKILNNTIKGSRTYGIYFNSGTSLTISNNTIKKSGNNGLRVIGGSNHKISNNSINESGSNGIYLSGNDNNIISNNNISYSNINGLQLEISNYNNVSINKLYNNTENGIYIRGGHSNQFWENDIRDSVIYGVKIISSSPIFSINNIFYNNSFYDNSEHTLDASSWDSSNQNYWNFSITGNFWDDYIGLDENDDRIGDIPYDINAPGMVGSCRDYYPIWDDGDDIPIFIIDLPLNGTFYGMNPPNFDISISIADLHTSWYSLNSGENYTFASPNGIINQSAWDACNNGIVKIEFFVNDTAGNIGKQEIDVI